MAIDMALIYLGRYLYRGVIQEKDILSCEAGQVRFRYRESKTAKTVVRTMSGAAFLRLSASQQQALDRTVADRLKGDAIFGIGMDETASSASLQVLWRADVDCAKTVAAGWSPTG